MKFTKILSLIAVMAIAFSCSKDDDAKPSLEDAAMKASKENIIQPPTSMMNSEDPNAQMAASYVLMANMQFAMITPPSGAAKSTTRIEAANGRASATSASVIVYTWSDPAYGSVAYQVSDGGDKYVYELFYKGAQETEWMRYLYGEQKKDLSSGFIHLIDIWGVIGENQSAVFLKYEWARSGDTFNFTFTDMSESIKFTGTINTKTKAGNLKLLEGTTVIYESQWDGAGNGTWKTYDSEGVLENEGSWTA